MSAMGDRRRNDRVHALHERGLRELDDYIRSGDPTALERARTVFHTAVASLGPRTPDRHVHFRNLAYTEELTYERTGALGPLQDAVVLYRQALDEAPADHVYRPAYAYGLGRALRRLYGATGDPAHLDASVDWQRRALSGDQRAGLELPAQLAGLAETLFDRNRLTGDRGDLDECVRLYRQSVRLTPEAEQEDLAIRLVNFGSALGVLHRLTREPGPRDESIDAHSRALALLPADRPERQALLGALAQALQDRYDDTGRLEDLDTVIALRLRAVSNTAPGTADHGEAALRAADALQDRGVRTGRPHFADQAIAVLRGAVAGEPADSARRAVLTGMLGSAYDTRYDLTGEADSLDQAVTLLRAALGKPGLGHHNACALRNKLSTALRTRHAARGAVADLDEGIALHSEALAAATDRDAADRALDQAGLAACLNQRFGVHGDITDLDRCAELCRQALLVLPEGDANRPVVLVLLGDAHLARFHHTARPEALSAALGAFRQALTAGNPGLRASATSNLARALLARFEHADGTPADLDEAIGLQRHAMSLLPTQQEVAGHNLAQSLRGRYEISHDLADLQECVDLLRTVVRARPQDDPDRIKPGQALAEGLYSLHLRTGDRDLLTEALAVARDIATVTSAPVRERLAAHVTWGQVSGVLEDWETAWRALRTATSLLPELATRSLTRSDQQYALARLPGIAAEAAAYALQAGRPEEALEVLEHGRGVLLGRLLRTRDLDLDRLRDQAPALADEFLRLREESEEEAGGTAGPSAPAVTTEQAAERRRAHAAAWQRLLRRIRELPGFDGFLRPPPAEEILRQAGDGPVVLLNISIRCDAVIVTDGSIDVLPLKVRSGTVAEQVALFLDATRAASRSGASLEEIWSAQETLSGVLEWLWDTITGPVLQRLGYTEPPAPGESPRRIWWCPQGTLAFLPLHAAGYHGARADPDRPRCALDLAVSSYTPTVGALHHARRRPGPAPGGMRPPLVVAIRNTPGAAPLPNALREAEAVRTLLPGTTEARLLTGDEATRVRVREALRSSPFVHLVCHAVTDPHDPSASRILTHDHLEGALTVSDISALRPSGAGLAYLSSCSTSGTRPELADEAIHITSAFQLAGYRHVVGTLWPVADEIAPRIAQSFYGRLPHGAAHALHAAVRRAHTDHPLLPSLWGAHIHIGP
ncbi:CHAT domain-containing protein [Streptomyces sp. NPDC006551]|uniref:CHAT domain-containing protein n=1 Tax=Streptomyces sp. NPDC006551 TaxID=3157178 RepID=UPI0033B46E89